MRPSSVLSYFIGEILVVIVDIPTCSFLGTNEWAVLTHGDHLH